MGVWFWYLVQSYLSDVQCTRVQKRTLDKSIFTCYQKNTAMFNWSPCMTNTKIVITNALWVRYEKMYLVFMISISCHTKSLSMTRYYRIDF